VSLKIGMNQMYMEIKDVVYYCLSTRLSDNRSKQIRYYKQKNANTRGYDSIDRHSLIINKLVQTSTILRLHFDKFPLSKDDIAFAEK
jgi:hypothetical protein